MIAQRRDDNEDAIKAALLRVGCVWIKMDKDAGFDAIVISPRNGTHIYETKNPAHKWKLTAAEEKRKAEVEAAGGVYNIIETQDQALMVAGYT